MKKCLSIIIVVNLLFSFTYVVQVGSISFGNVYVFDEFGEVQYDYRKEAKVSDCIEKDTGEIIQLDTTYFYRKESIIFDMDEETKNLIFSDMADEHVAAIELKNKDENKPYPEIEQLTVKIFLPMVYGGDGRGEIFGKDYRVYYLEGNSLEQVSIIKSDYQGFYFNADKLGIYVFYYNPHVFDVKFYTDEELEELYYAINELKYWDTFDFPEIPSREGYVFTGWKHCNFPGWYDAYFYLNHKRIVAEYLWNIYASWCPEEEYTPLEVIIDSEKKITKGKENGAEIVLTLSEGKFKEKIDENIEQDWRIVGTDELSIASVERIDDTTAKLTLAGNSSNKYADGEIQVEFNSELYISHEVFAEDNEIREVADIQLDENGIKRKMFISDNSITLEKQKKSNGGSGVTYYTVLFDTNGGENIASERVKRGGIVTQTETPVKEGYIFEGWYTDEKLTQRYDFSSKVTGNLTLYAAWTEDKTDKIILTVGKKEALVFGETVTNDVVPVIKSNRVMLPIRFVAESLGARVVWNKETPDEVKITRGEVEIIIYIGKDYAMVNGKKVMLDTAAFIENGRTYIPIRFAAENLGCSVEWDDETKTVTIIK